MNHDQIQLCDYAVAYIDLLGQKAAMPSRHLPSNDIEAIEMVKKSVGRIIGTQKLLENYFRSFTSTSTLYSRFPPEMQVALPDMAPGELKWQYFSDGLVIYIPLGKGLTKSPTNSIFGLLTACGLTCLVGLATKSPLRIGIDVAWAVEYRPNELYGSALAHAYKLESEVAQWPRVVVGEGLIDYLKHYASPEEKNPSSQFRKSMALECLNLIALDIDNNHIVDYISKEFSNFSNQPFDLGIFQKANNFAQEQYAFWVKEDNQKLAKRYENLNKYLGMHETTA